MMKQICLSLLVTASSSTAVFGHGALPQQEAGPVELQRFYGHQTGSVDHVAFLSDGERCLSHGGDATFRIWNCLSGEELFSVERPSGFGIVSLTSSSTGHLQAVLQKDKTLEMLDVESGGVVGPFLQTISVGDTAHAVLSGDDKILFASGVNDFLRAWSVAAPGVESQKIPVGMSINKFHLFDGDSKILIQTTMDIRLWTLLPVWEVWTSAPTTWSVEDSVLLGPNAQLFVTLERQFDPSGGAPRRRIQLWNTRDGKPVKTMDMPTHFFASMQASQDGHRLLYASGYQSTNTLSFIDIDQWSPIWQSENLVSLPAKMEISPDGKRALLATKTSASLWLLEK